jgi:hypothetical protein
MNERIAFDSRGAYTPKLEPATELRHFPRAPVAIDGPRDPRAFGFRISRKAMAGITEQDVDHLLKGYSESILGVEPPGHKAMRDLRRLQRTVAGLSDDVGFVGADLCVTTDDKGQRRIRRETLAELLADCEERLKLWYLSGGPFGEFDRWRDYIAMFERELSELPFSPCSGRPYLTQDTAAAFYSRIANMRLERALRAKDTDWYERSFYLDSGCDFRSLPLARACLRDTGRCTILPSGFEWHGGEREELTPEEVAERRALYGEDEAAAE